MIRSLRDGATEAVWNLTFVQGVGQELAKAARKKLQLLDAAGSIQDLRVPPGNRPEKLSHDRKGQHGIRVNDQYRICFIWDDGGADRVELTDYR